MIDYMLNWCTNKQMKLSGKTKSTDKKGGKKGNNFVEIIKGISKLIPSEHEK